MNAVPPSICLIRRMLASAPRSSLATVDTKIREGDEVRRRGSGLYRPVIDSQWQARSPSQDRGDWRFTPRIGISFGNRLKAELSRHLVVEKYKVPSLSRLKPSREARGVARNPSSTSRLNTAWVTRRGSSSLQRALDDQPLSPHHARYYEHEHRLPMERQRAVMADNVVE
ncbi:hypothetical protein BS47DRAFT_1397082 [Hydnum rufescens UP504]|uniref:Uncharacterized protein n=1 Tax=Hydnum rufescens UP504 TaxID=1448309 RepID=A0A9P6DPN9_9AGAM|nr:hypothetical protein BS47DRAFT_1397082 [Hydnum rufescens UP504]